MMHHSSNSQPIQTPQYNQPENKRFRVNANYIATILGALHVFIIVFLFPCWVSVAAVPKTAYLSLPRQPVEHAFLFFSVLAFLVEIALLIVYLLDVPSKESVKYLPWHIAIAVKDVLFLIPLFALSIAASVFESQQRNGTYLSLGKSYSVIYNPGAYASAAFFGFMIVILYIAHCALSVRKHYGESQAQS